MYVKKYSTYAIYYAAGKLFKKAQSQYISMVFGAVMASAGI
jgi:hypothetical protein